VNLILLIFAFVLFTIAAVWNPPSTSPWFSRLVAAGLAFLTASMIWGGLEGYHLIH
jgi:hypothetical protein